MLLVLAFGLGIVVAASSAPGSLQLFGLTLGALLAATGAWHLGATAPGVAALLLAAAGAGALRWTWSEALAVGTVGSWLGRQVTVEGSVLSTASGADWRIYDVKVEAALEGTDRLPASGLVRVEQPDIRGAALLPGQRGRFPGRLMPLGHRGADPQKTARLADRGIHFRLTGARPPILLGTADRLRLLAALVRRRLTVGIRAALPPAPASLLDGLLLSEGGDLPEAVRDDFRRTGLTHILAVDGTKVGAVLGAILWLLARLGWHRRRAALAAMPVLGAYCLLVGATAAAVRATLMAMAALAGLVLHRRVDAPSALALAALVLLVADPHQVLQLGFQLSFAATLGILIFYPLLEHHLSRWPRWLVEPAAVTVAVELAVEPLGLYAFGGLPLVSPLVHLWAMPVLAAAVPLGGLTALVGSLWPMGGVFLGVPTGLLLWLLTAGAHLWAQLPVAYWQPGRLPVWGAILWYAILAVLAWTWRRRLRSGDTPVNKNEGARALEGDGVPGGR